MSKFALKFIPVMTWIGTVIYLFSTIIRISAFSRYGDTDSDEAAAGIYLSIAVLFFLIALATATQVVCKYFKNK